MKWTGRCGQCQAWGTMAEAGGAGSSRTSAVLTSQVARPITQVDTRRSRSHPTGVGEFDRVLGGGLVADAVVLLAGEPGIGKSTLLLDVAARAAREGQRVLYISGEESSAQVASRAARIGALVPGLLLAAETDLGAVLGQIDAVRPQLLVVDSVQTIASAQVDGSPGNVSQVREVAAALVERSKAGGFATMLVGHVTKDGGIAGPRVLEHIVDVVLHFEGERDSPLRLVRAVKNRFGPTDEVGCFDLDEAGIIELPDPSGRFLSRRDIQAPGTSVCVALEGRRALVAEVQALVVPSRSASLRYTTAGVDPSRTAMVMAVLERHGGIAVRERDCYVSTVGGLRLTEPAADLSIAVALAGSLADVPVTPGQICLGEVGLAGDVRRVPDIERRLNEAVRLGFTSAIIPAGSLPPERVPQRLQARTVACVAEAVESALGMSGHDRGRGKPAPLREVPRR